MSTNFHHKRLALRFAFVWLFISRRYTLAIAISFCLAPFAAVAFLVGESLRAVAVLQLVLLVMFVNYARSRKNRMRAKEFSPVGGKRRVAVIGGGCAGIVACKEMLDEGHEVMGTEKRYE